MRGRVEKVAEVDEDMEYLKMRPTIMSLVDVRKNSQDEVYNLSGKYRSPLRL